MANQEQLAIDPLRSAESGTPSRHSICLANRLAQVQVSIPAEGPRRGKGAPREGRGRRAARG